MPYTEKEHRYPGKFEGNYSHWIAEVLYNVLGSGGETDNWSMPGDGCVNYYALVTGRRHAWIVHESDQGFFSYTEYDNIRDANTKWTSLVDELELEYGEEDDES